MAVTSATIVDRRTASSSVTCRSMITGGEATVVDEHNSRQQSDEMVFWFPTSTVLVASTALQSPLHEPMVTDQ